MLVNGPPVAQLKIFNMVTYNAKFMIGKRKKRETLQKLQDTLKSKGGMWMIPLEQGLACHCNFGTRKKENDACRIETNQVT